MGGRCPCPAVQARRPADTCSRVRRRGQVGLRPSLGAWRLDHRGPAQRPGGPHGSLRGDGPGLDCDAPSANERATYLHAMRKGAKATMDRWMSSSPEPSPTTSLPVRRARCRRTGSPGALGEPGRGEVGHHGHSRCRAGWRLRRGSAAVRSGRDCGSSSATGPGRAPPDPEPRRR